MANKFCLIVFSVCLISFSLSANLSYNLPLKGVPVHRAGSYAVFDHAELYDEPGRPALALYRVTFLVPPNTDLNNLSVRLEDLREEELAGEYDVFPALPPSSRGELVYPEDRTVVDGKDVSVYGSNAFFPAGYVHISAFGRMNQYQLVEVTVFPYRFNPVTKKMVKLEEAKLVVNTPVSETSSLSGYAIPSWITAKVKQPVVNYNEISPFYSSAERESLQDSKYVIMIGSDVVSSSANLQAFVDSKKARGFEVQVVTESDWGGGSGDAASDNVRKWLKDNYQSQNIQYALLIGSPDPGSDDIPMKDCYPNGKSGPTDFYFSELSGTWDKDGDGKYGEYNDYKDGDPDKFSEISVGRIPYYGKIDDLDHILEKIIAYENTEKDAIAWRMKMLLPMEPSDDNTPGNHLGEYIKDKALIPSNWGYHRIYDKTSPGPPETTPCSMDNVLKVWTEDRFGACVWWTHGSSTSASGIMNTSNAAKLDDNFPTYTFQVSCTNAKPEATNNLCYSLLKNGAIATVGGTRSTWYMPKQTVFNTGSNSSMGANYGIIMVNDSLPAGDACNKIRETLNPTSQNWWANWVVFVLFGDPSVGAYTCKSNPFIEITSPNGGELWEQGRAFSVTWGAYVEDGNVKVELLKDNAVEKVLAESVLPKDPVPWEIPADFPLGDKYKIRVSSLLNDTLVDESDDFFSITRKTSLAVKTPNGGELIEKESSMAITWEYDYDSEVRIDLYLAERLITAVTESVDNSGTYTWAVPKEIASGTDYRVRITGIKKSWQYDESDNPFQLHSPPVTVFPYVQPFDDFDTGAVSLRDYWEQQEDDDFDWIVQSGPTPSQQYESTGPTGDHTSGNGNYVYVEASNPNNPSKKTNMLSPVFDLGYLKKPSLTFWAHMKSDSNTMGDLYIDICEDGTWKEEVIHLTDDHGAPWFENTLDLGSYTGKKVQFKFRGITGESWCGDMCVDDFKIDGTLNHLPLFTTSPDTASMVAHEYLYAIKVLDDDNDTLTIEASKKPVWLAFADKGDGTAELKGTPQKADIGKQEVALTVSDGIGTVEQSFFITVKEEVAIIFDPDQGTVSDVQFTVYPNPANINGSGVAFGLTGKRGFCGGQVTVYDAVGNVVYSDELTEGRSAFQPWRLDNKTGKKVAAGSYLAFLKLVGTDGEILVRERTIGVKED